MKIRAPHILALLVLGSSGVVYAGKPPTAPANQVNVVGLTVTAADPNPPPSGVVVLRSPGTNLGSIAMWRGCYVVDPLTLTSDSSEPLLTASNQTSRPDSAQ